jgi:hypothetical protein
MNGGPKPPGPTDWATAHPPAKTVVAAMALMTKVLVFMSVSNSHCHGELPLLGIGGWRFH